MPETTIPLDGSSMVDYARWYAAAGFAVFPVSRTREPIPVPGSLRKPIKPTNATTDRAKIEAFWEAAPDAWPAVRLPRGLLVIESLALTCLEPFGPLATTLAAANVDGRRRQFYGRPAGTLPVNPHPGITIHTTTTGPLIMPPGEGWWWEWKTLPARLTGRNKLALLGDGLTAEEVRSALRDA